MNKDTNLFDLLAACSRAIANACKGCWKLFCNMLRLTYRKWYIVLPLWVIFGGLYYYAHRPIRAKYKVQGIVLLNGPSVEHFNQAVSALALSEPSPGRNTADRLNIDPSIAALTYRYQTRDVIDMLADGYPDFVDYKDKIIRNDTMVIHMQDRICLRFRLKHYLTALPQIEEGLLHFFNTDPDMMKAYEVYLKNLQREAKFHHDQIEKLDSLTSDFYFRQGAAVLPIDNGKETVSFGNRGIHLFLDDIKKEMELCRQVDQRLARATAPVVFEHHLVAAPSIKYHPIVRLLLTLLIGWLGALLIAHVVERWKDINAWLRA